MNTMTHYCDYCKTTSNCYITRINCGAPKNTLHHYTFEEFWEEWCSIRSKRPHNMLSVEQLKEYVDQRSNQKDVIKSINEFYKKYGL
jgi:hypothetical protein